MSTLMIGKVEYQTEERLIPQADLRFYPENPRVYSALNTGDGEPTQEVIQAKLISMDHVRQLKLSIKANGGIIDPLIVLDQSFIVLEGNSRLAAYRMLYDEDPLAWQKVKCTVLPATIPAEGIYTLLGQYHLIGRKDWSVFEQGAYLYRMVEISHKPIDTIASEIGITESAAKGLIKVYSFMHDHGDLKPDHWSYYEEYLKSAGIKKYRSTSTKIDETFVSCVKTGEIKQAIDVREKLAAVARDTSKAAVKAMQLFIQHDIDVYEAFDRVEATGHTNDAFRTLKRFREKLELDEFQRKVKTGDLGSMKLELKKILKDVKKLLDEIEQSE